MIHCIPKLQHQPQTNLPSKIPALFVCVIVVQYTVLETKTGIELTEHLIPYVRLVMIVTGHFAVKEFFIA